MHWKKLPHNSYILLNYSQLIKDKNFRNNILENLNNEDPVTVADLKVNELIINRIKNTKPVIGDGKKRIIHRERTISKKLRYWE